MQCIMHYQVSNLVVEGEFVPMPPLRDSVLQSMIPNCPHNAYCVYIVWQFLGSVISTTEVHIPWSCVHTPVEAQRSCSFARL